MSQTAACVSCPVRLYWALRNQRRGPLLRRDIAPSCARCCGVSCNPSPPCVRSQVVPSSLLAAIHWLSSNRLGMRAQPRCPVEGAHCPRSDLVGAMSAREPWHLPRNLLISGDRSLLAEQSPCPNAARGV